MLKFFGRGNAFADQHTSAYFVDGNDLIIIDCSVSSFQRLNNRTLSQYDHIYVLVNNAEEKKSARNLLGFLHFAFRQQTMLKPGDGASDRAASRQ